MDDDCEPDPGWLAALAALVILFVIALAWLGSSVTPVDTAGSPRLLSWSDWQFIQAERVHASELITLQSDAAQLTSALQNRPDPVVAQFIVNTVSHHVKDGTDPSLANARQMLQNAALDVRNWASGALDRNSAIESVQEAISLLK